MRRTLGLAAALFALGTVAAYAAGPAVKFVENASAKAKIMVDDKGMALYTFGRDEKDKTNCYNQCAVAWPPLMAKADDKSEGDWKVIDRTDGTKMWSYKGNPLYYWVKDTKAGDAGGESVANWFLVKE